MIWAMILDEKFSVAASSSKQSASTSYNYSSNSNSLCFSSSQAGGLSIIPVAFSNSKVVGQAESPPTQFLFFKLGFFGACFGLWLP